MSIDWGYTVPPDEGGGDIAHALAEANKPRHSDKTPGQWVKSNLFNNWYNTLITIVMGAIILWAGYYTLRFVFVTARWEPVEKNLELFMIGLFPREERTRIIVQLLMTSAAIGVLIGWLKDRAARQAELSGTEVVPTSKRDLVSSYSALVIFVVACLAVGARTINPYLVVLGCVIAAVTGYLATRRLANPLYKLVLLTPLLITAGILTRVSDLNNQAAYLIAIGCIVVLLVVNLSQDLSVTLSAGLAFGVIGFQGLSGTFGLSWVFLTLALIPATLDVADRLRSRLPDTAGWVGVAVLAVALVWRFSIDGIAAVPLVLAAMLVSAILDMTKGDPGASLRFASVTVVGTLVWAATEQVALEGVDWGDWSGLHLSLTVATASIVLAFPVGLLLALARRSTLPVLRWMSTAYIELIRGVPLISLLLMGQFFIGFFLNTDDPLSNVTRATAAITMFSAAYIAEIVRGGLQSVPKGQTEAGQALGLSAAKITRLLVLPQALRNVIPAMVGQFISLFKDTSLLSIIAITEFLGIREIVHGQEAFRGFGIAETLVFVGFGFWAFSFTMSRESQRLERKLGVGQR